MNIKSAVAASLAPDSRRRIGAGDLGLHVQLLYMY